MSSVISALCYIIPYQKQRDRREGPGSVDVFQGNHAFCRPRLPNPLAVGSSGGVGARTSCRSHSAPALGGPASTRSRGPSPQCFKISA